MWTVGAHQMSHDMDVESHDTNVWFFLVARMDDGTQIRTSRIHIKSLISPFQRTWGRSACGSSVLKRLRFELEWDKTCSNSTAIQIAVTVGREAKCCLFEGRSKSASKLETKHVQFLSSNTGFRFAQESVAEGQSCVVVCVIDNAIHRTSIRSADAFMYAFQDNYHKREIQRLFAEKLHLHTVQYVANDARFLAKLEFEKGARYNVYEIYGALPSFELVSNDKLNRNERDHALSFRTPISDRPRSGVVLGRYDNGSMVRTPIVDVFELQSVFPVCLPEKQLRQVVQGLEWTSDMKALQIVTLPSAPSDASFKYRCALYVTDYMRCTEKYRDIDVHQEGSDPFITATILYWKDCRDPIEAPTCWSNRMGKRGCWGSV